MLKRNVPGVLAALLVGGGLAALFLFSPLRAARAQGPVALPGRYVVVLKESVADPAQVASELARAHGLQLGPIFERALKGFGASFPEARLSRLRQDSRVAYIEQDQLYRTTSVPLPTGIDRVDADASATAKIDSVDGANERVDVDIAILDTGIQTNHPDLYVVGGRNFATFFGSNTRYNDGHGHGTHVAGIAAAKDNGPNVGGVHVVGVAPGARLWAVKVLDNSGFGWTSWIIAGVDWVTDTTKHPPIEVANMSLSGPNSQALNDAITRSVASGVTYVVAAGNNAADCKDYTPANHTSPGVLTVSALADYDGKGGGLASPTTSYGADDTFATFSNFGIGEDGVDMIAPGVEILSTWRSSGYRRLSGTSMAAPHVAGVAALYRAKNAASPADVRAALLAAARPAASVDGYTGGSKDGVDEPVCYAGAF